MDRANDAVGGASGIPINVDDESVVSGDNIEHLDESHAELNELFRSAGIGTPSRFEPSIEPSIDESGGNAIDKTDISFDGYNFQNALRCADLSSGSSLPDLPWEAPAWRCIFDDKFDPLESLNPTSMLSGPAIPFLPKDSGELEQLHPLISSKRCHGVISGGPLNRANQAAPLRVSDLVLLHETLETSDDDWNRLMSGACLFCVYARARWSDFIHSGKMSLDRFSDGSIAYVEMDVAVHKTMFASARRFRYLNLAAPGLGVHGTDWVSKWIEAFEKLGIDPFTDIPGCVMPAPDSEGRPLARALESDEAGCWLRLLLGEKTVRSESSRAISTHSMKATMLSFAAKRGHSHQDRLSLGHHVHPYQMADVYARDAAARDLRLLDSLIREVRSGIFKPDESRAGRLDVSKRSKLEGLGMTPDLLETFSQLDEANEEAEDFHNDAEPSNERLGFADDLDDGANGYVTTDSSESDTDREDRELVQRHFYPPVAPAHHTFVQHQKSKLLHYLKDGNLRVLACGRTKSSAYVNPGALRYDSAVCHSCQTAVSRE